MSADPFDEDNHITLEEALANPSPLHAVAREFWQKFEDAIADNYTGGIKEWGADKGVKVVGVDDASHTNADLIFIPHDDGNYYMGTTVVFVPQCSDTRDQFFLYPGHLRKLIEALLEIEKVQNSRRG